MEVRPSRIACRTDSSDGASLSDTFSIIHIDGAHVPVPRIAVKRWMIQEDLVPITVPKISFLHDRPVEEGRNLRAVVIPEVHSRVELVFPRDRVDAPSERGGHGKVCGMRHGEEGACEEAEP